MAASSSFLPLTYTQAQRNAVHPAPLLTTPPAPHHLLKEHVIAVHANSARREGGNTEICEFLVEKEGGCWEGARQHRSQGSSHFDDIKRGRG